MHKNRLKKSWDNFNMDLYLNYLANKLTFKNMSKKDSIKHFIDTVNNIPNNRLFLFPLIENGQQKQFIVNGNYDGLVLTDDKYKALKKYFSIIAEVYKLSIIDMVVIDAKEQYETSITFILA